MLKRKFFDPMAIDHDVTDTTFHGGEGIMGGGGGHTLLENCEQTEVHEISIPLF